MRIGTVSHVLFGALALGACTRESSDEAHEHALAALSDDVSTPAAPLAQRLVGHYALRTRVAVRGGVLGIEHKSLAVHYGLVDIYELDGQLRWSERGCRSLLESEPDRLIITMPDAAVRSTPSLESELVVSLDGDTIHWQRPQQLWAAGFYDDDAQEPLPQSARDPRVHDADGDGRPGMSAHVKARMLFDIEGEVQFVERSRSSLRGVLEGERLVGEALVESEWRVLDASKLLLRIPLELEQDLRGEHSVLLVPLMQEHSCDDLVSELDVLFSP